MKKRLRIVSMVCVISAMIAGCAESETLPPEENQTATSAIVNEDSGDDSPDHIFEGPSDDEDTSDVSFEYSHTFTPVFDGWEDFAGGPDHIFKVSKLIGKNGETIVSGMCKIEKCMDSYGYPMWFCEYDGRLEKSIVMLAEDGSWKHTLRGAFRNCYMDQNGLLCIESTYNGYVSIDDSEEISTDDEMTYQYKVGTKITSLGKEKTKKTEAITHAGVWDSNNKTLIYQNHSVKLPSNISYANYESNVTVEWINGIYRTNFWDGNIFAVEGDTVQYLFDPSGDNLILMGIYIDRVVDSCNHKVYYTVLGFDSQLRVYNQDGEYISDLEGRFVAECWDGVFWTVNQDERAFAYCVIPEYEIYSKSIEE